jgi:hypothetical protein
MSTIWWIVVHSAMAIVSFYVLFVCKCVLYFCHWVTTQLQLTNIYQTSIYTICHHTCPVTLYVCNRCSYAITLCTTGNQIIGILYHTYAFVQYICIKWTGLGQHHIATCLLLQLCKKMLIRKDANGMLQNIKYCVKCH